LLELGQPGRTECWCSYLYSSHGTPPWASSPKTMLHSSDKNARRCSSARADYAPYLDRTFMPVAGGYCDNWLGFRPSGVAFRAANEGTGTIATYESDDRTRREAGKQGNRIGRGCFIRDWASRQD